MRKVIMMLAMCFMAVCVTPSFASVGVKIDNAPLGVATDIRFNTSGLAGENTALSFDGSRLQFNLMLAGSGTSGATSLGTGNTDVQRGFSVVYKEIGTGSETGIIHNGLPGEMMTIIATEAGAGGRWTLTQCCSTTWVSITFNAANEDVSLIWLSNSVGWVIFGAPTANVVYESF